MALPTQYAMNSKADVTLFFVRPATLEGRKVQITECLVSNHDYWYAVKKLTQINENSTPYMTPQTVRPGIYLGASLA